MSFDLYILDLETLRTNEDELYELLAEDETNLPLTPRLAGLLEELDNAYPADLADDSDSCPWASFPVSAAWSLAGGRGAQINVRWSPAEHLLADISARCAAAGLIVYDPQGSSLEPSNPGGAETPQKRRWWRSR